MTARKKKAIHLLELTVENFKRLRFARLKIDKGGKLIRITGDNFSGKTSLLEAVDALTGGAKRVPAGAINDEAEEGARSRIEGRYSNGWTVERRFSAKAPKGYLKVVDPDGEEGNQGDLNGWSSGVSAAPMFFFKLPEADQHEILLGFAGADVKKNLDELADRAVTLRTARTPFNSEVQRAERSPEPVGDRPDPVDVSTEMARLDELRDVQDLRTDAAHEVAEAQESVENTANAICEMEEKLTNLKLNLEGYRNVLSQAEATQTKLPEDPTDEIQTIRARIDSAQACKELAREWESHDAVQSAAAKSRKEAAKLTRLIKETEHKRKELVAGLKTDVPGLSFNEDGVPLLLGRELHAASGGQKATFAADVAFARNNDLRVALIDEGDALDDAAIAAMAKRAEANDFIVLLCTLGREGAGEIIVEDGVALTEGEEAPEEGA